MQLEPQVTFKNVDPSDLILGQIEDHLGALEQKYTGIVSCRLVFERPPRRRWDDDHFRVDLVLTLQDGIEIAVNRNAPELGREDFKAAIREAFEITERRISYLLSRRHDGARYQRPAIAIWGGHDREAP